MPTVLFLCTGNYYRSRFAEIFFNARAAEANLAWRATSRALALERGIGVNHGPISVFTLAALKQRNIPATNYLHDPQQATADDFSNADLVIAVKEAEHRPLMEARFPDFTGRMEYWHIHDLDAATPDVALTELEQHVLTLLQRLKDKTKSETRP